MDFQIHNIALVFRLLVNLILAIVFRLRSRSDVVRRALSWVYFVSLVGPLFRIVFHIQAPSQCMSVLTIFMVDYGCLLLLFVPVAVLLPGMLNLKRVVLFCSPTLVMLFGFFISLMVGGVYYVYPDEYVLMNHFMDVNVWIRFVYFGLMMVQFMMVYFLPHFYLYPFRAPLWFKVYLVYGLIWFMFSLLLVFHQNTYTLLLQDVVATIAFVWIGVYALTTPYWTFSSSLVSQNYSISEGEATTLEVRHHIRYQLLFNRLVSVILRQKFYLKATVNDYEVCLEAHIPYEKLPTILASAGYISFNELIASCRVQTLKNLLLENPKNNLSELYLQAGFSNRMTGSQYFNKFEGMSPTAWLKQQSKK